MLGIAISLALICLVSVEPAQGTCRGCIDLDELTFDKMLARFPVAIVKFDIAYPYGEKHEAYAKLATEVAAAKVDDLLVSVVGVKDYGEKDNAALAKRFKVRETYPDIKLFLGGNTTVWIDYPGDEQITSEQLKQFIRRHSTIYIGLAGCLREYDELARKFVLAYGSSESASDAIIEETNRLIPATTAANGRNGEIARIYLLLMRRIREKGLQFAATERQRLQVLLLGHGSRITDAKKIELTERMNILRAFDVVAAAANNATATSDVKNEL